MGQPLIVDAVANHDGAPAVGHADDVQAQAMARRVQAARGDDLAGQCAADPAESDDENALAAQFFMHGSIL